MTLALVEIGHPYKIKKITGNDDIRRLLANLGFVCGVEVCVVSVLGNDKIISVNNQTRVALAASLLQRIIV